MHKLDKSLAGLEKWFEQNPYLGYDPFDIKGHPLAIPLQKFAITRKVTNLILELAPRLTRHAFGVQPRINNKGLALLANAYLQRYATTSELIYLKQATKYLDYLHENAQGNEHWAGWGYPFDWQSKIFIPENTPSVVVTVFVGDALFEYREITGENRYDILLKKIAVFITTQLNIRIQERGVCFSYTPLDSFFVHNANLFAAFYLTKLGLLFKNDEWIDLGQKSTSYTVADQRADGAFTYWGSEHGLGIVDNFHTGYVLRMLTRINSLIPSPEYEQAIQSGTEFYSSQLFKNDFPLHSVNRPYPIDIHTLTEVLLVHLELRKPHALAPETFTNVLNYLLEQMQGDSGAFHYKHYKYFKNKMSFFRWTQAWTFYTLSRIQRERLSS
ncbi:hypothetical protein HQ531_11955 [bacterium]|nr:hypothetical protein [bacterium]